jgi:hypothetical protein
LGVFLAVGNEAGGQSAERTATSIRVGETGKRIGDESDSLFHNGRYSRAGIWGIDKKKVQYQAIEAMKDHFPHTALAKLCGWFGMTRQAYYQHWRSSLRVAVKEELILGR